MRLSRRYCGTTIFKTLYRGKKDRIGSGLEAGYSSGASFKIWILAIQHVWMRFRLIFGVFLGVRFLWVAGVKLIDGVTGLEHNKK